MIRRYDVPNFLVRLPEPRHQYPVFGETIEITVCSDDRCVDSARKNQNSDNDHKDMEGQSQHLRTSQMHGETAEQVVHILRPDGIRNNHRGQQSNDASRNHGVNANDVRGDLEVLQLRRRNLTIDLSQRFKSAHCENRVAEGNDNGHRGDLNPGPPCKPSEIMFTEFQVGRSRRRRNLRRSVA